MSITFAAFHIYAQSGVDAAKRGGYGATHWIIMEITLLIMKNHGKIMELCFWISAGTLKPVKGSNLGRHMLI